jgi:uncharacterized protein (DUF983 family)
MKITCPHCEQGRKYRLVQSSSEPPGQGSYRFKRARDASVAVVMNAAVILLSYRIAAWA